MCAVLPVVSRGVPDEKKSEGRSWWCRSSSRSGLRDMALAVPGAQNGSACTQLARIRTASGSQQVSWTPSICMQRAAWHHCACKIGRGVWAAGAGGCSSQVVRLGLRAPVASSRSCAVQVPAVGGKLLCACC